MAKRKKKKPAKKDTRLDDQFEDVVITICPPRYAEGAESEATVKSREFDVE